MPGDFFDTNVVLYLFDDTDERKRRTAERLLTRAFVERSGGISFQVVQEVFNVISTKLPIPASQEDAQRFLEKVLLPLWKVMPSADLYMSALQLNSRYNYHFYDALIIAAALESGAERLYSEDFQGGQKIGNLTIVNPFSTS